MDKTNPMRILDHAKIEYKVHDYSETGFLAAMDVAKTLGEKPEEVFKTLVTQGKSEKYYVFVVPATGELDLKKAATSVGEKSVSMIPSKELLANTGYVHGGCSPLGLRKPMKVIIDQSAKDNERFYISAGKIGLQIEMRFEDLSKVLDYSLADIKRN